MSKYEPLRHYLENHEGERWEARFTDIERLLGFALPESAHRYPAWWANQEGHHSQTKGWRDAGWETRDLDLAGKRVKFIRSRRPKATPAPAADLSLWSRAEELTGISDRDTLTNMALQCLIAREAANELVGMGGKAPEMSAPPRRGFSW